MNTKPRAIGGGQAKQTYKREWKKTREVSMAQLERDIDRGWRYFWNKRGGAPLVRCGNDYIFERNNKTKETK